METQNSLEIRNIEPDVSEIRLIGKSGRNVVGHAIVFNSESRDLGGFVETILPEAIDNVLDNSDVLALLNHSVDRGVLARSKKGKGTLKLEIDKKGVRYDFEAPNTSLGNEVIEGIQRGDISTSSFAFKVAKGGEKWEKREDGSYLRTIKKLDAIFDVSMVYHEAYENTDVAIRNLDKLKEEPEPEVKVEDPEIKPVAEEPAPEPIIERSEPEIKVEEPKIEQRNINLNTDNKMTITELKDLRAKALEENDKIYAAKKAENRTMTETEEAIVAQNNQRVKEYDLEIETESRKSGKGLYVGPYIQIAKEKQPFSLIEAIRAKIEQREMPAAARDMFVHGRESFRRAGVNTDGDIILPFELRTEELVAGTQYLGQEMVPEDKKPILPPLWNQLVFSQAGATFMPGLTGTVSIPSFSDATIAWKSEIEAATTAGITTKEVLLSPKRLTAFMEVSKLFLIQSGPAAERMLMDILSGATARKLESTILGVAVGSSTQPQGIGYKITTGLDTKADSVVPAYSTLVGLESAIDANNALVENLAYITNASGRGILKSIDKGVNNDTGDMLCSENNMVNGYKLLVTNGASAVAGDDETGDLLVFGNWKDLVIGQWGGYDITVDPYTAAKNGMVVLTVNAYFDAKGLRGSAATDNHAATEPDDYAISFASTAIKLS
jgi:HK97 family phage prohead protease/HK97 family phage major capsid protein